MKLILVRASVLTTALLLAGCFGSQPTTPAEKFYRLPAITVPATTAPMATTATTAMYALEPVDARGVYVERSLLYCSSAAGSPLQQYPYASWAEPPDVMLQDQLLGALRNALGVSQVLAPGQRRVPAVRVSMRLRAMEQIRDGSSAQAHFAARYTAVDGNGAVLFVLDWDRQAPAGGASPLEFVNALAGLIGQADQELIERLHTAAGGAAQATAK